MNGSEKVNYSDDTNDHPELKKTIILQNVLFPTYGVCREVDMYYRGNHNSYIDSCKCLIAEKEEEFRFDTYFNGFSAYKWNKYTNVNEIDLELKFKGSFKLILLKSIRNHDRTVTEVPVGEYYIESANRVTQSFTFGKHTRGMLGFVLVSLEKDSYFYGGHYCTSVKSESIRRVSLAITMCTYRREDYIKFNIDRINNQLLSDPYIKDKLHVYISDNGKTLDTKALSNDYVVVVWNKNTGGAGGFTRGLIEGMNSKRVHTHYLFMDDDIIFETDSIYRTISLLSILREEFLDSFIGGTMLRMDKQTIIHESGAIWSNGKIRSLKQGIDVSAVEGCLYNEVDEGSQYNAWWYCTIPAKHINKENLPCPLFIKADDIEYSLRNMSNLILINGISVWHEPFDSKYAPHLHYYITRNRLIVNSVSGLSDLKETIFLLRGEWIREMYLYRYDNAKLILNGVEDFLKGVDYFKDINPTELHEKVMGSTYKMVNVENLTPLFSYHLYDRTVNEKVKRRFMLELGTFNGAFIPMKKKGLKIVHAFHANPSSCFGFKEIISYDYANNKGFYTKMDNKRMIQSIFD